MNLSLKQQNVLKRRIKKQVGVRRENLEESGAQDQSKENDTIEDSLEAKIDEHEKKKQILKRATRSTAPKLATIEHQESV